MSEDAVNHPKHYVNHPSGVECITITEAFNFCLGNAIKYIWRAGLKGDAKQDLEKARWYVDREIQRLSADDEAMGPWEHVGHTSDEGFDKLEADGGRLYTASLRPYLDKLKDSARGGLVGEQGPELMPLKVSYSVPTDDEIPKVEEFDNPGLVGPEPLTEVKVERASDLAPGDQVVFRICETGDLGRGRLTRMEDSRRLWANGWLVVNKDGELGSKITDVRRIVEP